MPSYLLFRNQSIFLQDNIGLSVSVLSVNYMFKRFCVVYIVCDIYIRDVVQQLVSLRRIVCT